MTRWLPVLALALGVLAAPAAAAVPVASLTLDGAITPITVRLVELALAQAQADGASALLVRLDTPGGLERSTRSIVQRMLAAEIPVVVYVSPTGARAASAGVFITMAAHVAATLGAARLIVAGGTAGVLDANGVTIRALAPGAIGEMTASGAAHSGMVAKLAACRHALAAGVGDVRIVTGRGGDFARAAGTVIQREMVTT